jgi:RimJ/RimL family protein N-acetyltransferase
MAGIQRRSMRMNVEVREADPEDAESLIKHIKVLTAEPNIPLPLAPDEFRYTVDEEKKLLADSQGSDSSLFLVAYADGRLVGELTCRANSSNRAHRHVAMLGMSVAAAWRGKGIGAQLMSRAIEWVRQTNTIKRIEIRVFATNERAIRLYTKSGFVQEGVLRKAAFRDGKFHDTVVMALLL